MERSKKRKGWLGVKDVQEKYGQVACEEARQTKRGITETERERTTERMEEGSHRCGGASGNTSHYGVNCSSGDVVERSRRSPSRGVSSNTCTHTHKQARTRTHRGNRENIWICATCLEEVI